MRVTEVLCKILTPLQTTGEIKFQWRGSRNHYLQYSDIHLGVYNSTGGIHISIQGVYNFTGGIHISIHGVYNFTEGIHISIQGVYNFTGGIQISILGVSLPKYFF